MADPHFFQAWLARQPVEDADALQGVSRATDMAVMRAASRFQSPCRGQYCMPLLGRLTRRVHELEQEVADLRGQLSHAGGV